MRNLVFATTLAFAASLFTFSSAEASKSSPNRKLVAQNTLTDGAEALDSNKAADAKKLTEKLAPEVKKNCDRHFPGMIQAEIRSACTSVTSPFARYGKSTAQINCRLSYGEEPRLVMACLIGVAIADGINTKNESFKQKLQLCAEHYPAHTEVDAFLQESCLTGIHLPELLAEKPRVELCGQITPERSFLGPCGVGLSLSVETSSSSVTPAQQNKICEQYFDHRLFHAGYRACLNARSVALNWNGKYEDALKNCTEVVSDKNSDTERAACLVGTNIFRSLSKQEDVSKRFQKCGDLKVSYQDRDFLACLTAASLLDFTDKNGADHGCKEIFKTAKTRGRGDCLNSLALF